MAIAQTDLRILQVTARYPPYIGGVESHVYQVSRRLAHKGLQVGVLTTDPQGNLAPYEVQDGVKIQRVRAWPAHGDYYFAPAIYRSILRGNWDLLHIQSYHTFVPPIAMLASRQARIPYVVTFHGGGHSSKLRGSVRTLQRKMLRPLLNDAARLITVAEFETPFYSRELHIPLERFCLIPNGADLPDRPRPASKIQGMPLIVSVGRLERYKGHQRLIEAMPALVQAVPNVHLWIAGSGPYESTLLKMAKRYGVEDRVDIHAVPGSARVKMAEELSRASVAVLLSEFETHPLAILEAISLGIPAIVSDTSGLHELAEKGLAQAIPLSSSAEQIAAVIAAQIRQPQLPRPFHLPTWDDCADRLIDLYQEVVKPK